MHYTMSAGLSFKCSQMWTYLHMDAVCEQGEAARVKTVSVSTVKLIFFIDLKLSHKTSTLSKGHTHTYSSHPAANP